MGQLNGGRVLLIVVAFFGVIIAVNMVLAVKAVSTFPGLEVGDSYVASQEFEAAREAQEALGWTVEPRYDAGRKQLKLTFTDKAGHPAALKDLTVLVGRPTESRQDVTPVFTEVAGAYVAPVELAQGKWMMHVEAHAADGTLFRQRLGLVVGN